MNLIQYISLKIDDAIKMLMDNHTSKTDVALFLMDFKNRLIKGDAKKIVDGNCKEIEIKRIGNRIEEDSNQPEVEVENGKCMLYK